LSLNRRGLLAVLAIAVSVGYALVAGATVTGLENAQDALAQDLQDPGYVITRDDGEAFESSRLPVEAETALATVTVDGVTFYTSRGGEVPLPGGGQGLAGPSAPLPSSGELVVDGVNLTVEQGQPLEGARTDWIAVDPGSFQQLGGSPSGANVAHVSALSADERDQLASTGFQAHQAPAATGFYVSGTDELVTSVGVTVASSALVVALLASGFVNMEIRAKRQTLSTLKLYAGTRRIRRVIAGRGLVLLVGGHLLALAVTAGLTTLLTSASRLDITLSPTFAAAATGATFLGGTIGLAGPLRRAGERVEASALAEREPAGWLPTWLRPSLASWRILVPLVAASLILAASLGVVFGMVDLPTELFGQGGEEVIASTSANPLRGRVDPFPGFHLGDVDGYKGASPEIFAPSTLEGRSVMVRGISWPHVAELDDLSLSQGRAPQGSEEALAGTRLAKRADLSVGDSISVPSAYSPSVTNLQIVGIVEGGGLLSDELLVPLPTARGMTQLDPGQVNMVRYETTGDPPREKLPEGLEATSLTLSPEEPVPFEEVTARVGLVNFADTSTTRQFTLRVDGEPVDDAWPTVSARSTGMVEMSFTMPKGGVDTVKVNPETQAETGEPAYVVDVPPVAVVERSLEVDVRTRGGDPASGVQISLADRSNTTNAEGRASFSDLVPGNRTISVSGSEGRAARSLLLVERANLHRAHPVLSSVEGPDRVDPGQSWAGVFTFVNLGGEAFEGRPTIEVDDNGTRDLQRMRLLSGQQVRVSAQFSLDEGQHTVGTNDTRFTFEVTSSPSGTGGGGTNGTDGGDGDGTGEGATGDATVEELLQRRREQAQSSSQAGQSATQAFLGDTFENLNAALTLIVAATILHAGLITLVAVFRQVDERAANVGTLSAIGASEGDVRGRAIREYLTVGLPAAILGVAGGLFVAWLLSRSGLLTGFGHTLGPRTDAGFAIRIVLAAVATTLVAALLAVQASGSQDAGSLMDEGPSRSKRPSLETLTGASER
jgi:ABC-type lipoprotein release transport system permease subunit